MAYAVISFIVMAHTVMTYAVISFIVMAHTVMADVVMAHVDLDAEEVSCNGHQRRCDDDEIEHVPRRLPEQLEPVIYI